MANIQYYDVILKPVVTEKSMELMADKKYTFLVHTEATKSQVKEAVEKIHNEQKKVAIIASESFSHINVDYFFSLGKEDQLSDAAHLLYQALRDCDETDADIILVPVLSKAGVGTAIMNRLEKAADGKWFYS